MLMNTQEQPAPRGRGRGRPFQKGQSGNPAGRKKRSWGDNDITALAREASPDAVQTLIDLFKDKSVTPGVRATCADKVLDRAWGKAVQVQALATARGHNIGDLTDAQLVRLIAGEPLAAVLRDAPTIEATALPAPGDDSTDRSQ